MRPVSDRCHGNGRERQQAAASFPLITNNSCPKRTQGQFRNLEKLYSERNSNDGDAPHTSDRQISEGHPPAIEQEPDYIYNK